MNYLVTGASRGIGYATALALAEKKEDRVLALSRSTEALRALQEEGRTRYGTPNIEIMTADLATVASSDLQDWVSGFGALHGVVNNAGLLIKRPFLETTPRDWERSFNVNFFAVVRLLQALHPLMEATHIVNIGSMSGVQGSAKFLGLVAYGATKAALANLTEGLAEEWKSDNIRCNCLALGAVQTEMLNTAFPGYEAPVSGAKMGEFVAWFLRQGQHFFNGKILPVAVDTP